MCFACGRDMAEKQRREQTRVLRPRPTRGGLRGGCASRAEGVWRKGFGRGRSPSPTVVGCAVREEGMWRKGCGGRQTRVSRPRPTVSHQRSWKQTRVLRPRPTRGGLRGGCASRAEGMWRRGGGRGRSPSPTVVGCAVREEGLWRKGCGGKVAAGFASRKMRCGREVAAGDKPVSHQRSWKQTRVSRPRPTVRCAAREEGIWRRGGGRGRSPSPTVVGCAARKQGCSGKVAGYEKRPRKEALLPMNHYFLQVMVEPVVL